MDSLVPMVATTPRKALPTNLTTVRFDPAVEPHVRFIIHTQRKRFVTFQALETLVSMTLEMRSQIGSVKKTFPTDGTFMRQIL